MAMHYHYKGEARKRRASLSRADRTWYRAFWQAVCDRHRAAIYRSDDAGLTSRLQEHLKADLEFSSRFGVK